MKMQYITLASENAANLSWGVFVPHEGISEVLATVIMLISFIPFLVSFVLVLLAAQRSDELGGNAPRFHVLKRVPLFAVSSALAVGVAAWAFSTTASLEETVPVEHIAGAYGVAEEVLPEQVSDAQTRLSDGKHWLVRAKATDQDGTSGYQWGLIPNTEFGDWAASEIYRP